MKPAQVEALRSRLLDETGIDFEKYRTDALLEALVNIVTFPAFAFRTIRRPILLLMLTFLVLSAIFLFSDKVLLGLVFFPFSLSLAGPNGLLIGLLMFIYKMAGDFGKILHLSLETVKSVVADLENVYHKARDGSASFPSLSEITLGVLYIVMLPSTLTVLRERIPLVGRPAAWSFKRVFDVATRSLVADVEKDAPEAAPEEASEAKEGRFEHFLEKAQSYITSTQKSLNELVKTAMGVAAAPLWVITLFMATASTLFLSGIYFLLS